jgi:predicted membrane-bound spermidine synthase
MNDVRRARVFWGVAVVSLSVLLLQLAITRLFSATMYYHYAFLAISLALFGSGASGVLVYLLGQRLDAARANRWLALSALLFALTTVVALLVILGCPVRVTRPTSDTLMRLTVIYAASALPFLFGGGAISLAVTNFAPQMSRLYLFDLCGAAAGCLALIPVLNTVGAVNTVLLVTVLAAGAACLFESSGPRSQPVRLSGYMAVALALGLVAYNLAFRVIDVRVAKGSVEAGSVIFSKWNSFSRITVSGNLLHDHMVITIDADAATVLSRDGSNLDRHEYLRNSIESLAYHLRPNANALIIGPGGGRDVITAKLFGARHVDAVEVNPIIALDVMSSEPFRSYSGDLYRQPGVRLVVDEGRSFVRGSRERYDIVQGTMVDTWAATAAGAYALTENNLYTVEAFGDYLQHLSDTGILSMTRWHLPQSDQLLRLVSLARVAMTSVGIEDASWRVILAHGPWEGGGRAPATFLFSRRPFSLDEVRQIEDVAARSGMTLLYTPSTRPDNDFTRLITAPDPSRIWRAYESNIEPSWDNSPFFFHSVRLGHLRDVLSHGAEWRKTNLGTLMLLALLAISVGVTTLFIIGPLALARGRLLAVGTSTKLSYLMYFGCLGAGFIIVEVALIQKCILFLGHPTYSLTVVLFSLLLASGLGSAFSGRFDDERARQRVMVILLGLALALVAYVLAMSPLLYALVQLDRVWRIAIVVALLFPLGFVMGMPMPSGIRVLARTAPELVPWAWGVNGAMSVLGSIAALVIALLAGFNQALLVGAGLYLLAIVFIVRTGRPQATNAR